MSARGRRSRPPRVSRWIASRLLPPADREFVLGDLDEEFALRGRSAAARRWYRSQALRSAVHALAFRTMGEERPRMRMNGGWDDLRFAFRSLIRTPGFTALALLTLAVGIGANTAVFSLVDGVLLRPLPFEESDALVQIGHEAIDGDRRGTSEGFYLVYAERARTLEGIALHRGTSANLVSGGEARRVAGEVVTPGFFPVLRSTPVLGRTFTAEDGRPGGEPVVILAEALWRSEFGADPAVLGTAVILDGVSRTVIGVMPAGLAWPDADTRFWVPMVIDPARAPMGDMSPRAIARLAPGVDLEDARAEIGALLARIPDLAPGRADFLLDGQLLATVVTLKESIVGDVRRTLLVLVGSVGIVLLIGCANVANLLLVRAEGRSREMAVRVALGAGRLRAVRTLFSESVLLAIGGVTIGLLLARAALAWAVRVLPTSLPRAAEVGLDGRSVAVAIALAGAAAILSGLLPALRYTSGIGARLRTRGTPGASDRGARRLRSGLVVVQIALAMVLLTGAGLMIRSSAALRAVHPGFEADGVVAARLTIPAGEIPSATGTAAFQQRLLDRVTALPGVQAAGLVSVLPLSAGPFFNVEVSDHPRGPRDLPIMAHVRWASPGYFDALGIDLVEGRPLQAGDAADGRRAAVVSRAFAERWWPGASALGRRIRTGFDGDDWYEIVGVTGDVHIERLEVAPEEAIYFPTLHGSVAAPIVTRSVELVVRAAGDPLALVPALQRETRDLNAHIPLATARSMSRVLERATARTSFTTSVLTAASLIALFLGIVGIYGVVSYLVSRRTREIGLRMALGAEVRMVRRMIVRQGLELAAAGVLIGVAGTILLSAFLASLLYGVAPTNPVTYAAVAALLLAVAACACWIPATRAARVQPSRALQAE